MATGSEVTVVPPQPGFLDSSVFGSLMVCGSNCASHPFLCLRIAAT